MRLNRVKPYCSYNLIMDLIILLVQPIPYVDFKITFYEYLYMENNHFHHKIPGDYLLSDFILLFMFLRVYLVVRNIFNHSQFSDPYAKLHCERYGFTANNRFVYK